MNLRSDHEKRKSLHKHLKEQGYNLDSYLIVEISDFNEDYETKRQINSPTPTDTKAIEEEARKYIGKHESLMIHITPKEGVYIHEKEVCGLMAQFATSHNSINSEMLDALKLSLTELQQYTYGQGERHENEVYAKIKQLISTAEKGKG